RSTTGWLCFLCVWPLLAVTVLFNCIGLPPTTTLFPYTTLFRSLLPQLRKRVLDREERRLRVGRLIEQREVAGIRIENLQQRTIRSEEHTSELQSLRHLVCRLLLEKKKLIFSQTANIDSIS